jgi:hypothetical protein
MKNNPTLQKVNLPKVTAPGKLIYVDDGAFPPVVNLY